MKKLGFLLFLPSLSWGVSFLHSTHDHKVFGASATAYLVPDGYTTPYQTEAPAQVPYHKSGLASGFWIYIITNSMSTSSTITLRINGADASQTITIPGGTTGPLQDLAHIDFINAGDLINFKLITGTGGTIELNAENFVFTTPSDGMTKFLATGAGGPTGVTNGFADFYTSPANIMGSGAGNLTFQTEGPAIYQMKTAGTFENFAVYITSNTRSVDIPIRVRKNGSNTALTVTIPAGDTGLFEDTTHSFSVVNGDSVTYSWGSSAGDDGHFIGASYVSSEFVTTNGAMEYPVSNPGKQLSGSNDNVTTFSGPLGFDSLGNTYGIPSGMNGIVSHFHFYSDTSTLAASTTFTLRKNGVNGNSTITVPRGGWGYYEDTTHTDVIVSTDIVDYRVTSGAGIGSLDVNSMGAMVTATIPLRGPSDTLPPLQVFPSNNIWNTPIDSAPISSNNAQWMDSINGHTLHTFHADFGSAFDGKWNGIPYNIIYSTTPYLPVIWDPVSNFATESDTLPANGLPFPPDIICQGDPAPTDVNGDRHCLLVQVSSSSIFETFGSSRQVSGSSWTIVALSTWALNSNALRPDTWTSADAAGLPIFPALVKWQEVNSADEINHALRFTLALTHGPHLWPARHDANSGGSLNPPFGMRVRIKANIDISGFSAMNQKIFRAMKKYGMFLADNGGDWYVQGAPNLNWNDTDLNEWRTLVPADTFEVVDESTWIVAPNSGEANASPTTAATAAVIRGQGTISGYGTILLH